MNHDLIKQYAENIETVDLDMLTETERYAIYQEVQEHPRGLDDVVDKTVNPEVYEQMQILRRGH